MRCHPRSDGASVFTHSTRFLVVVLACFLGNVTARAQCPSPATCSQPDVIERTEFCLYYTEALVSDYAAGELTEADAERAADIVEEYWDRYVNDFGFRTPAYTGKLEVCMTGGSCNGCTGPSVNWMKVNTGCYCTDESIRKVIGHELFHRVQYAYDGVETKWFKEGTARAMEDNVFDDIDNWPEALTACSSSFNKEKNDFISKVGNDLTSNGMRYESSCWWKYFTEQFGSTAMEPELGVNAFLALWEAAETLDDVAAVNAALSALGAGVNFDTAFRRFAVACWTKDLDGTPDGSYGFIDEDQVGNPAPYGPIVPLGGSTITMASPSVFSNQTVERYGAKYYQATPGTDCDVVSVRFNRDSGANAFYHVVTQDGSDFGTHVEGNGASWTQSFLNDGLTNVVAIIGGQSSDAQVDIEFSCADPALDIRMPNSVAVADVGPFGSPGKFLVQVLVTNGTPDGPVVAGLTNSDFKVRVGGNLALITAGSFIQEQYWLVVQAPSQAADGLYDLEVDLEAPGTATVLASDTNSSSVRYANENIDHVIVIDRSGSMLSDGKMIAAEDAAKLYVDVTRNFDGIAVVPFNGDIDPAPFDMMSVDTVVRGSAKSFITALMASGATSIGDGMAEAVNQIGSSTTGNTACSIVLLSDGMENTEVFWVDVETAVVATGCPVRTISFGPGADEILMQSIATATGGSAYYNDVFVSAARADGAVAGAISPTDMALELGSSYEYIQSQAEGRQRLLLERGVIPLPPVEQVHTVIVDESVDEAVFGVDWAGGGIEMVFRLRTPSGDLIEEPYTFEDFRAGHLGFRIPAPEPGVWELLVTHTGGPNGPQPYQVFVSGSTHLTVDLLLPDRLGTSYFTGNRVPIYAFVSSTEPLAARVEALVTGPDGTETPVPLHDDGLHGDGTRGDGLYAGVYTRVQQANPVPPGGDEPADPQQPNDEGSYRVRIVVRAEAFEREALGAFTVLEGPDLNGNRLPDPFETENGVDNTDADPDLDQLDTLGEYLSGTDPNLSDTDGGGEQDGSEVVLHDLDPLDPSDDEIEAPEFFVGVPQDGAVLLTYDVKEEYETLLLYRADSADGPWQLINQELPLEGSHSDPVPNGTTVYYRYFAIDGENHFSAVLQAGPVTPSEDPVPPEARIIINGGAPTTMSPDVTLTFLPDEANADSIAAHEDITEMQLSNRPNFEGVAFVPFQQDAAWTLDPQADGTAFVYARFRDAAGNESIGVESASIVVETPEGLGPFSRGDCNGDADLNLTDPVFLLQYLFLRGDRPPCLLACDADDRGQLNIADAVNVLNLLFNAGDPLPPPFPGCGRAPARGELDCETPAPNCL